MYSKTAFVFDGVPSTQYGLMIYYLDDASTRDLSLGTDVDIVEDRLSKQFRSISYGVNVNQSLSFPLTFGSTEYLDESQIDEILTWLTGHQRYKWLELVDIDHTCDETGHLVIDTIVHAENPVRYRCHINNVNIEYVGNLPFAFSATVELDSQFGYEEPRTFTQEVDSGGVDFTLNNPSSYNGYIFPTMRLTFAEEDTKVFRLINTSDNSRVFELDLTSNAEASLNGVTVEINNLTGVMTNDRANLNLYKYFNNKFFRLLRGDNELRAEVDAGSCTLDITCEFLRKVAGHTA